MDRIFFGMLFVLLDIEWNIGDRTIGLLPDWLGYWWLFRGFWELEDEWDGFRKWRNPALGLGVYSLVLYILDLLVLTVRQEFLLWAAGLIAAAAAAVMARVVVQGVGHLENSYGQDLQGRKLGNLWVYLAVILALDGLLNWIPVVGTGCAVASFAMGLCWLAALWGVRKTYD